jgi:hypothetical protein
MPQKSLERWDLRRPIGRVHATVPRAASFLLGLVLRGPSYNR